MAQTQNLDVMHKNNKDCIDIGSVCSYNLIQKQKNPILKCVKFPNHNSQQRKPAWPLNIKKNYKHD